MTILFVTIALIGLAAAWFVQNPLRERARKMCSEQQISAAGPQFLRLLVQLLQNQSAHRAGVIGLHLLLWTAAFQLALVLRFDGAVPPAIADACKITLLSLIAFRLALFGYLKLFAGLWRYTGLPELQRLIFASTIATVLAIALEAMVAPHSTPRSLYVGEWLASVIAVGGIRMLIRSVFEREVDTRVYQGEFISTKGKLAHGTFCEI